MTWLNSTADHATCFRPNELQRRYMRAATAQGAPSTVASLCRQVGMPPALFYHWVEDTGFRVWMAGEWMKSLADCREWLAAIAHARAATDPRYARLLHAMEAQRAARVRNALLPAAWRDWTSRPPATPLLQ